MPFPVHGAPYYALASRLGHAGSSPYVDVPGSHFGAVLDDPRGHAAKLFSTTAGAVNYALSLPAGAYGRTLPVLRVRWHGGSVFTLAC